LQIIINYVIFTANAKLRTKTENHNNQCGSVTLVNLKLAATDCWSCQLVWSRTIENFKNILCL